MQFVAKQPTKAPNVTQRVKDHLNYQADVRKTRLQQLKKTQPPKGIINNPQPQIISTQDPSVHQKLDRILSIVEKNDKRVDEVESQLMRHEENFSDVDHRLNEIERARCNMKMEITGLNFPRDTPRHLIKPVVCEFLHKSNIAFNELEIVDTYAFRRRIRNDEQTCIIVTFLHEAIKNRIITDKIRHDKNNQVVNVFFSHVLTKAQRHLLLNARRAVREKKLIKAWSMSGNVFVVKNPEEGKILLLSYSHLIDLIGGEENNEQSSINEQSSQPNAQGETSQPSYSQMVQLQAHEEPQQIQPMNDSDGDNSTE